MFRVVAIALTLFLLPAAAQFPRIAAAQGPAEVTVDLARWQAVQDEIARLSRASPPPTAFAVARRSVDARFVRGVLTGTLNTTVDVFAPNRGPIEVPLVGGAAALGTVTLDGERSVARRTGTYYAVPIASPGRHVIKVEFALGQEQARFSRAFVLPLPVAPITHFSVRLPENDLDVTVAAGVVLNTERTAGGTIVRGAAGSRPELSVAWKRRSSDATQTAREMEVEAFTLLSPGEELLRARTTLACRLVSGETDRVEVQVPDAVEVTGVEGDAVLQWFTATDGDKTKLVVLLRHLVDDEVRLLLHTQMPVRDGAGAEGKKANVALVRPINAAVRGGFIAVEGHAGFDVSVEQATNAAVLDAREVPAELRDATERPILFAYRHGSHWPELRLGIERNQEIDLTQAVIDDLQASTVLAEKGLEVTKLRMYVRNNTRHHLALVLPDNAELTHALIDGDPFLPASTTRDGRPVVLVPLPQSEKLEGTRAHVVTDGETLSEIAQMYYGQAAGWQDIASFNGLFGAGDIHAGQQIAIPTRAVGVTFEESNFVLELAYKRPGGRLSRLGSRALQLPRLDIPVMSATWHLYIPGAYEPLSFQSNLQQLSAVRYDLLRRLEQIFADAGGAGVAHAGGGSYVDILSSRKEIYQRERKHRVREVLAEFPLIGRRYRFRRVLLGDDPAEVNMVYADRALLPIARWSMFGLALLSALFAARRRGWVRYGVLALAGVLTLGVGHYVLGVHRAALLGADAGLLLFLAPTALSRISQWRPRVSFRGFAKLIGVGIAALIAMAFPLFLGVAAFAPLAYATIREVRRA